MAREHALRSVSSSSSREDEETIVSRKSGDCTCGDRAHVVAIPSYMSITGAQYSPLQHALLRVTPVMTTTKQSDTLFQAALTAYIYC